MSDLQCPARFVLLGEAATGSPPDVRLVEDEPDPLGELAALADLHRGETVVVAVPAAVASRLPEPLRPPLAGAVTAELDADGWRLPT